jgi:hypothetical protein
MDKKKLFEQLTRATTRRGGVVGISSDAPPEIVEAMLAEMVDCPLCEELAQRHDNGMRPDRTGH